jgi:hypothetical protein
MTDGELKSINEPDATREAMLTPVSINEPPTLPAEPTPQADAETSLARLSEAMDPSDPDELEDELEQAEEEGDFKPLHRGKPNTTLSNKRSKNVTTKR